MIMEQNINALYPRPKGRGSTAIFDRKTKRRLWRFNVDY